jgi:phosphate transport system substrate-binding protein
MTVRKYNLLKQLLKFSLEKIMISRLLVSMLLLTAVVFISECSGQPTGQSDSSGSTMIQGSGSTFVQPLMVKWASEYGILNPSVKIDYQSTGSGAGIKAIQSKTSAFGASDVAMSDKDLAATKDGEIIHIPVVLGAVVLTYNLPGVDKPLNLSPEVISDIFLGKIKKWSDPKLKTDNPEVTFPDTAILPVYRADGSGTSDIFTDYLSKTVPEWKEKIGRTKNPQLPTGVGIGGKGNEGVMGQVKQNPNSIGYVELTFAKANKLPAALIKNKAGKFIEAGSDSVSKAAAGAVASMPEDLRFELTNSDGEGAYPISGMVFVLVYKNQEDAAKGKALVDFLWWVTHEGTKFVTDLHYSPLPAELVAKVEQKIGMISSGGAPLRK